MIIYALPFHGLITWKWLRLIFTSITCFCVSHCSCITENFLSSTMLLVLFSTLTTYNGNRLKLVFDTDIGFCQHLARYDLTVNLKT